MKEIPDPAGNANGRRPASSLAQPPPTRAEANQAAPAALSTEASLASGLAMLSAQLASMQKAQSDMLNFQNMFVQALAALNPTMYSGGANANLPLATPNHFSEPAVPPQAGLSQSELRETMRTSTVTATSGLTSLLDDNPAGDAGRPLATGGTATLKRKAPTSNDCSGCGSPHHCVEDKTATGHYVCPIHASKSPQGNGRGK